MELSPSLQRALDDATVWRRVRLTGSQAASLVADFKRRAEGTSWAVARAAQPSISRELPNLRWSDAGAVSGARLVALVEAFFALTTTARYLNADIGQLHALNDRPVPDAVRAAV